MKTGPGLFAGVLMGVALQAHAGISTFPQVPGFGAKTYSQAEYDQNYQTGRNAGRTEASAECLANPANCGCNYGISPCGTTVTSLLAPYKFGEIEPNDHLIAATGLISEISYWGQSRSLNDQDWFYVTTQEPNQVLTLNFTVPNRVLEDTSRLSQGWLVSVRDAAGNVYAQFDTRYALDDPITTSKNESREITYTVFLGHVGTFYVVVEPQVVSGSTLITQAMVDDNSVNRDDLAVLYSPYNLAAILTFSAMDAAPPDVNFHDVESEPNNDAASADPIATGVTMTGQLRATLASGQDRDEDWFVYQADAPQMVTLGWCGRYACTPDTIWFVEALKPDQTTVVASYHATGAESFSFGLEEAGPHYLRVSAVRPAGATCLRFDETANPRCTATAYQCRVLSVTPPAAAGDTATCVYANGTSCGEEAQSGGSVTCSRTDLGQNATAANGPVVTSSNSLWFWGEVCTAYSLPCLEYVPAEDATVVQYNFTWWGTKLLPNTYGTDAFDNFLTRPSWYQDR